MIITASAADRTRIAIQSPVLLSDEDDAVLSADELSGASVSELSVVRRGI